MPRSGQSIGSYVGRGLAPAVWVWCTALAIRDWTAT